MAGWRKMETAPKDGTHILLLCADWGVVEGWWDAKVKNFYRSNPKFASYDQENEMGDWVSRWNETDGKERRLYCGQSPQYWRPIPKLPKKHEDW